MKSYAVCHVSKGKGASKGLTAHNERKNTPKNADPEKAKLNKIEDYRHLGDTLEQRADAVIKKAGVKRKVQKDAVKYCPILLSGSHEQMEKITKAGKLDEWMEDNRKFIEQRFGKDNVISFAMHADELTPHIHVSVVPIMEGGRKKDDVRLSAKDMFNPGALKKLQTQYAEAMQKWGFERGEDAQQTRAKHQDTSQYYKQLPELLEEKHKEIVQAEKTVKSIETAIEKYGFKMPEKGLKGMFAQSSTSKSNNEALLCQISDLSRDVESQKEEILRIQREKRGIEKSLIAQQNKVFELQKDITDLKKENKWLESRTKSEVSRVIELVNKNIQELKAPFRFIALPDNEGRKRITPVSVKDYERFTELNHPDQEQKQAHKNTPGQEPDQEQSKGMSL